MTSTWDELRFYGQLACSLFSPSYDLHKVPGPPGQFGVGHIPKIMRPDYHVQMLEWADEYGGVYKFSLGCQWVVVISDPALALQVLGRGANSVPRKCVGYQFFDLATNHLGSRSFFTTTDEVHWAAVRKAVSPSFNMANVKRTFAYALKHSEAMAADILDHVLSDNGIASPPTHCPPPLALPHTSPVATAAAGTCQASGTGADSSSCTPQPAAVTMSSVEKPMNMTAPHAAAEGAAAAAAADPAAAAASLRPLSWAQWLHLRSPLTPAPIAAGSPVSTAQAVQGKQAQRSWWGQGRRGTCPTPDLGPHPTSPPTTATCPLKHAPAMAAEPSGPCPAPCGGSSSSSSSRSSAGLDATPDASADLVVSAPEQAQAVPAPGSTGGVQAAVLDLQEHLEHTLLNVFVEALFEVDVNTFPCKAVAAAMNLTLEEANERLKVPLRGLATWITNPKAYNAVAEAQQLLGHVFAQLADVVISRRPAPPSNLNMWACLSRLKDPRTGQLMDRDALVPEIGALMMAGFDTGSHTIAWCLFALATHPEHQAAVRQELVEAGLLQGDAQLARPPGFEDLSHLTTLNCVIDETMRMYPVAATASVREVSQATKVGNWVIPPGVIVWPMLYALHNSQHNWEAPEEFRPSRWLDRHSRSSKASSQADLLAAAGSGEVAGAGAAEAGQAQARAKAFLPFSDGIKSCLGQALGLMEVRTALVALLSRFHFELDPSVGSASEVHKNMIMSLTLKMKGGLRLRCTPLTQLPPGHSLLRPAEQVLPPSPPAPATPPRLSPPAAACPPHLPTARHQQGQPGQQQEQQDQEQQQQQQQQQQLSGVQQSCVGDGLQQAGHAAGHEVAADVSFADVGRVASPSSIGEVEAQVLIMDDWMAVHGKQARMGSSACMEGLGQDMAALTSQDVKCGWEKDSGMGRSSSSSSSSDCGVVSRPGE
ncbi:hypothetical protein QJQ45_025658 [Haematococcus lacustris]|nr:hypothetical protein QJQ45_025658 [Haematococcus lacustris]